ncbi:hypothetical protein E2C01_041164 [Portunus trituberculatus]|uniref:Uncharacterized protein n=1 Tax=Portunus trituberculatus TaxID=210409 RepID=A0A5B7FR60_PORTR|nr:hypothetical protein [Portunus trituberculatus]
MTLYYLRRFVCLRLFPSPYSSTFFPSCTSSSSSSSSSFNLHTSCHLGCLSVPNHLPLEPAPPPGRYTSISPSLPSHFLLTPPIYPPPRTLIYPQRSSLLSYLAIFSSPPYCSLLAASSPVGPQKRRHLRSLLSS